MLTITKVKSQAEPIELLSELAAEIDLFGQLAEEAQPILAEITALQLKLKPMADAKKALEAKIDALDVDDDCEGHVEKGAIFEATVGKRGKSREIKDLAKVKKLIGVELFMKLATVKLGDIDNYLTPPQKAEVLKESRTAHSVKVGRRV